MDEREIVGRIHKLVARYHELEKQHHGVGLSAEQRQRLSEIQVQVDRLWEEVRRQRASKRSAEMPSLAPPQAAHTGSVAKPTTRHAGSGGAAGPALPGEGRTMARGDLGR
jgi:hypothetical protein